MKMKKLDIDCQLFVLKRKCVDILCYAFPNRYLTPGSRKTCFFFKKKQPTCFFQLFFF